LLEKVKHPFLVSLEFAFQTKEKIFFIMNFIRGG
jgi:serum/glucocorticoid-regulated kinase 2